jgi:hypothetical protein
VKTKFTIFLVGAVLSVGTVFADDSAVRQDARALDVLKSMSAYTDSLDKLVIVGVTHTDARLGEGLMVSNSDEVKVAINRPDSLHITSFDGVETRELIMHQKTLTVFNSERGFYAQASIPSGVDAALEYALEVLDVEAPLMDFIIKDKISHLIGAQETVIYLTDKARVAGVDCHHIVIRGPETDVQLWIEEGDKPVPRKILFTSKWEAGSPRFMANLAWLIEPELDPSIFEFNAPEGSMNIGFVQHSDSGGE